MRPSSDEIEELLQAWNLGDQAALEKLVPLVHHELELVAHAYLRREAPGHELEASDLITEVFIRLIEEPKVEWQSRTHFFALAARRMRQILVDYARKNLSAKRGHRAEHVPLLEAALLPTTEARMDELLSLNEALDRLALVDKRKTKVVELTYFGGMTFAETAQLLDVSPVTVEREWRVARAWLRQELVVGHPIQSDVATSTKKTGIANSLTPDKEQSLAEASSNREMIAILMSENWAGLKLLVQVRGRLSVTKPELVSAVGVDAKVVNSILLKLKSFGVFENKDDVFALNKRGHTLLESFEKAIGKSFD